MTMEATTAGVTSAALAVRHRSEARLRAGEVTAPTRRPDADPAGSPADAPTTLCRCGHDAEAHEHYRPGSDCGACGAECGRFRRGRGGGRLRRLRRWWHRPPGRACAYRVAGRRRRRAAGVTAPGGARAEYGACRRAVGVRTAAAAGWPGADRPARRLARGGRRADRRRRRGARRRTRRAAARRRCQAPARSVRRRRCHRGRAGPHARNCGAPHFDASGDDPGGVLVATSGSTGRPRLVVLPPAALRASAAATAARLGGPGRWLLALPADHVAGVQVIVRALLAGAPPVVQDLRGGFRPAGFAAATARLGPGRRYTSLVPTQLLRLLDAGGAALDALRGYDAVLVGGAALDAGLRARAEAAGVRVVATYGMTETAGGLRLRRRPARRRAGPPRRAGDGPADRARRPDAGGRLPRRPGGDGGRVRRQRRQPGVPHRRPGPLGGRPAGGRSAGSTTSS